MIRVLHRRMPPFNDVYLITFVERHVRAGCETEKIIKSSNEKLKSRNPVEDSTYLG